jgi:ABC-type multidrug transport system ATPase subunit
MAVKMRIILDKVGKRYSDEWIFRNLSYEFSSGEHLALTGPNGSGKSTLLNIISSRITPDEGQIIFESEGRKIKVEDAYQHISVCSSSMELIEEFTLAENINFFLFFKKLINENTTQGLENIIGLKNIRNKKLQQFSSGMKQRVKLALALYSDVPFILMDEPCTNLDAEGVQWYRDITGGNSSGRTFIVSSNEQAHEYYFCEKKLFLPDYKK